MEGAMREVRRTPLATNWGMYDVTSADGRIQAIERVAEDPEPSPIGPGMVQAHDHPSRVARPAVRRSWYEHGPDAGGRRGAEPFVEVSWDTALDLAAAELHRVKRDHGNEAIYGGSYGWASAGRFHHCQSQIHRFLAMHGGFTGSLNSYSCAAMEVILPHVIGGHGFSILDRSPQWDEVLADGELVVAFGGMALRNRQVTNGGAGSHGSLELMRRCGEAGVRFVNVGPIRDDVSDLVSSTWLAIRPNADVALMLALAHTLVVEGRHDQDFLDRCCVGFDQLAAYLLGTVDGTPKDAEWAAPLTEIPAEEIRRLARDIATHRTLISLSWSLQRCDHGEQAYWMAVALAAMSGSMGRPGGGLGAGYGSLNSVGVRRASHRIAAFPQPANPVDGAIPVARIADALLAPGARIDYDGRTIVFPDIRLIQWMGGNPFHHHQDLNRLVEAWQRPETIIVHESWWTATARHADIVFPAATSLERNDFAVGHNEGWLAANAQAVAPAGEARTDYDCLAALAERLGFGERFTEGRSADEWVRALYDQTREALHRDGVELGDWDAFVRQGRVALPVPQRPTAGLIEDLRRDPQGASLATPSGRVELFSQTISDFGYDDCPGHPVWLEPAEWLGAPQAQRFPLHLISNQPATRLHSQYDHGGASQASKVARREPVRINRADAAARGIADGDVVRLFNDRGACLAGARVSDAIRPGVVQLSTGAWYDPADPGVAGSLDRHGNANVLTLDKGTSRLAQGSSAQTALVEVERFDGAVPPVGAFVPPAIVQAD